jgi:hypothetical protein
MADYPRAFINAGWRPVEILREITKGKHKGDVEVRYLCGVDKYRTCILSYDDMEVGYEYERKGPA